jgi:hypothetical protein
MNYRQHVKQGDPNMVSFTAGALGVVVAATDPVAREVTVHKLPKLALNASREGCVILTTGEDFVGGARCVLLRIVTIRG